MKSRVMYMCGSLLSFSFHLFLLHRPLVRRHPSHFLFGAHRLTGDVWSPPFVAAPITFLVVFSFESLLFEVG